MKEEFKEEISPAPENIEDQKYCEVQKAEHEENRIMREIDRIFATASSREEAEKIILEKWIPQLEEARKKSDEARKAWLDAMNESMKREKKELDDMEKSLSEK